MNIKAITAWSQRATLNSANCTNETLAKSILILPFFQHLGYDPNDPKVVVQEHRVDLNKKYPDRADIVFYVYGKPAIVVECKAPGKNLTRYFSQLSRYYDVYDDATLGVLTDGVIFHFFSETDADGSLEPIPFLTINLEKIASRGLVTEEVEFLSKVGHEGFDKKWITQFANTELLRIKLTNWLSLQLHNPSPQFCRYVLGHIDIKNVSEKKLETYAKILRDAFAHGLADKIYEKIQDKKTKVSFSRNGNLQIEPVKPKIITTDRELEIFSYCKQRLTSLLQSNRLHQNEISKIDYEDKIQKFSVFYSRKRKGKMFDYAEENGREKFVFFINGQEQVVFDAPNIDKPLLAVFRQKLLESQSW
ncbi:MAG: type I restriction enzyme HsdR N-terminal domain-containing protein [Hyphomicrobiales bacterium]|nr:type I restriction enzyme HsdR N-terminal domain-containing protein [Hyphomicrobiales bacterium]